MRGKRKDKHISLSPSPSRRLAVTPLPHLLTFDSVSTLKVTRARIEGIAITGLLASSIGFTVARRGADLISDPERLGDPQRTAVEPALQRAAGAAG